MQIVADWCSFVKTLRRLVQIGGACKRLCRLVELGKDLVQIGGDTTEVFFLTSRLSILPSSLLTSHLFGFSQLNRGICRAVYHFIVAVVLFKRMTHGFTIDIISYK